jgi:DNA polymerase-3 subunit beta
MPEKTKKASKKKEEDPLANKLMEDPKEEKPKGPIKDSQTGKKISFMVKVSDLQSALSFVKDTAKGKNLLPILDYCHCSIVSGNLLMRTTNLNNDTSKAVEIAEVEGDLTKFLINIKDIAKIIDLFTVDSITINFEDNKMMIFEGFNVYEFVVPASADDYPRSSFENWEGEMKKISLPIKDFGPRFKDAVYFTAADEVRPIMNGVLLECWDGKMGITATNANILYHFDKEDLSNEPFQIVLDKDFINNLIEVSKEDMVEIILYGDKFENVAFRSKRCLLSCRTIEGKYPTWRAVTPTSHSVDVTWNRKDLFTTLKKVNAIDSGFVNSVKINITDPGEASFSRIDLEYGRFGTLKLSQEREGDPWEGGVIGFNSNFMLQGVKCFSCDKVTLEMSKPNGASMMKEKGKDNMFVLLMPVMTA